MKKFADHKDFQIYTLLVRHPYAGGPSLPVATHITTRHDAGSIRRFLEIFLNDALKICGSKTKPIMVMIDGSMAMWNVVLRAFANETRLAYYDSCWRIITGKAIDKHLNTTLVHNCLSHAMRAAKILVTKHYNKKFRKVVMYWISLIYASTTFDELKRVMRSVIVILNCEKNSKLVKHHFEKLRQKRLDQNLLSLWDDHHWKGEKHIVPYDFLEAPRPIDEKQELNSKFCWFFERQLESFIASFIFSDDQKPPFNDDKTNNVYFDRNFCKRLIRVVLSRICSTSQLMLGDLSRHYVEDGDISRKRDYEHFSLKYRNLEHSSERIIASANQTQGSIEQYFFNVKSIYLKNKRIARVDEFVEKMYKELRLSQRLFADQILHGCNIPPKQIKTSSGNSDLAQKPLLLKKTRLVGSKFRKGRKRRNSGYYSSSLPQKQIKFVGVLPEGDKQQSIEVSAVAKTSKTISLNLTVPHQFNTTSHPHFMSRDKNKTVEAFALKVWQSLPSNREDLFTYAIVIDEDHTLTWLDVLNLNPAPSSSMFDAITAHYGSSGKGWLSKYLVDAFLSVIVLKVNQKKTLDYVGHLDCYQSSIIINRKPIFNKHVFARQIIENKSKELRANIFVPVLLNKHFLLFWYCRSTNCLTLFNSVVDVSFRENSSCLRLFKEFLESFLNAGQQIWSAA